MLRVTIPVISICIPTYNRKNFLIQGLESITKQFDKLPSPEIVEIIISDDSSSDNTEGMVKKFQERYHNIRYYKNKKNIGSDLNIIKSASYAKGEYIWFLGDDDLHYTQSLATIIKVIENNHPDAIIGNLDLCSSDGKKIIDKNLLRLKKDVTFKTKRELFTFLESKFFTTLDWYYTCMSNTIVSQKIYQDNLKQVMKLYNPHSNNFLHSGLIYYNSTDYSIYFPYKTVGKYRTDNRSFGPNEKTHKADYLLFLYQILKRHNNFVYKYNHQFMSSKFKILLFLKNTSREARRILVKKTGYDISDLLIRLFPQ